MAIDAVSVLELKFGGVDLLFDADGNAHIAEVNFPTDFGCCQEITGIDIATMMLEFASHLERPS
jgi:glutathione synthase/RimK-type ligase-like ATP-grasp enzyme